MATAIELIQEYQPNRTIAEALIKADYYLNTRGYQNIVASISGGADSDVVMDICERLKPHGVHYIWFDTGLEYQATKDHLKVLEAKYEVEIERVKPKMPIPTTVKKYGVPFLSKMVAQNIGILQRHNFDWQDVGYEEFLKKYPDIRGMARWLYSKHNQKEGASPSIFDINRVKYLKEYLFDNPPDFPIANKCCHYAKKTPSHEYSKSHDIDLMLMGIRKSEGGIRSINYTSCFDECSKAIPSAQFRPIFWFTNADREEYENLFGVVHSKCYTEYGFKRTGCAACPFAGTEAFEVLDVLKEKEPKLYRMAMALFGKAYEYQNGFYQYRKLKKAQEKELKGQLSFFDMNDNE